MTPEQAVPEVKGCKETLEKEYGVKVVSFAYPYGGYNSQLFDVLKQVGFTNAVTTEPGMDILSDAMYAIPRMRAGNRIGQELTSYLQTTSTISLNSALLNQN
jgi:peptidoglycan/xylan/chitin deacetylase (PgdA/CDA1 family)